METKARKKYPPDQMNIRLGSQYIKKFNEYMDSHGGKKIDFIRDALDYWMSVDAKGYEIKLQIDKSERDICLREEHLKEIQIYYDERIKDLNRIIDEKDARIEMLQTQLKRLDALIKTMQKER